MVVGIVGTGFTMSLDGFIAGPGDDVSHLFGWYSAGDVTIEYPGGMTVTVSPESAEQIRAVYLRTGAIVTGRRLFDITDGWGGRHPIDVPVFVVTHEVPQEWVRAHADAPFTFVTEGVERAVELARATAGDRNVGVGGANVAQQAIKAGLIDEITVELVPVLLGSGVRFFDHLGPELIKLEQMSLIEAPGVTHVRFRILK